MKISKKILSAVLSLLLVFSVFYRSAEMQTLAVGTLPETITFEEATDLNYFLNVADDSTLESSRRNPLSEFYNASHSTTVLGNDSSYALRSGPNHMWFKVNPIYLEGKDYNAITGKLGFRTGNDLCLIYDYTDENNFKGFTAGNSGNLLYINSYTKSGGTVTEGTRVTFKTSEFVNSEYTANDSILLFFDFKLYYTNGGVTFAVTSDAYNSSGLDIIYPEITVSGTGLNDVVLWGYGSSQYDCKLVDDLKIYLDETLSCEHEKTQTVADEYLKSTANCVSPAVYYEHCSKCGTVLLTTFTSGSTTDHSHEEIADKSTLKTSANCQSVAVYYKSCGGCGKLWGNETFLGTELGGHRYVSGDCLFCDAVMPEGQEVFLDFEDADDIKSLVSFEDFTRNATRVALPAGSTNNTSGYVAHTPGGVATVNPDLTYGMGYNMITGKIGLGSGCIVDVVYDYIDSRNYKAFRITRGYAWTAATGMTASFFNIKKVSVVSGTTKETMATSNFDPICYTAADTAGGTVYLDFILHRGGGLATFKIANPCYLEETTTEYEPIARDFYENDDYAIFQIARAERNAVYLDDIRIYLDTEYQPCSHPSKVQNATADYFGFAANCLSPAIYYESCAECGLKLDTTFEYGDLGPHSPVLVETVPPNCITNTDGVEQYYECSLCKLKFADSTCSYIIEAPTVIPAGHYYDGYTYDENGHWKVCVVCETEKTASVAHETRNTVKPEVLKQAATCYSKAVYYKSCDCGYISDLTFEKGSFAAHTLSHLARVEPDCDSTGREECWYCSACDKYFKDAEGNKEIDEPVIPIKHKLGEYLCDANGHWQECSACDYVTDKAAHTPNVSNPLGIDKVCTTCAYHIADAIDALPTVLGAKLYTNISDVGDDLRIRFDVDFSKLQNAVSNGVNIDEFGVIMVTDYTGNMTAENIAFDATEKSFISKNAEELANLNNGVMKVYANRKVSEFGTRVALVAYLLVDGEYYYSNNTVGTDGSVVKNGVASKCVADMMKAVFAKGQYSITEINSAISEALNDADVYEILGDCTKEEALELFKAFINGELRQGTFSYAAARTLMIYTYYYVNL